MERTGTRTRPLLDEPLAGYTGSPQQLSAAIDVVAWLAEQAWRVSGRGPREMEMSQALHATFEYMVQYMHHLSIDGDPPQEALVKAAAGTAELNSTQIAVLRSVGRIRGKPRLLASSFESTAA